MTPANRITTSIAVSSATGTSTMRPSQASRRPATAANGEAEASPGCAISMAIEAALRDLAGVFLQHRPRLVAVLAAPLLVEAGGFQLGAERLLVDRDEFHVLGDHIAHVGRQPVPRLAVGEEPEAVPHVVGLGEILLHLEQLGKVDDRER